jgi:hypothetical protein
MVSLALFLAVFGPASTRYGFPSGNSSAAPIDAFATVTPVSCEDVVFPPPRRADLWNLSTPNAEETQSPFSFETSSFPRLRSSSLPFPRLQFEHYRFRDFDYRFRDFSSTITVCET